MKKPHDLSWKWPGSERSPLSLIGRASRSSLFLFVMLAAFLGQSIAIQGHVHAATTASAISAHHSPTDEDRPTMSWAAMPDGSALDCPFCTALAMAGHYLPPASFAIIVGLCFLFRTFALPAAIPVRRQTSHRWQSRAPPQ